MFGWQYILLGVQIIAGKNVMGLVLTPENVLDVSGLNFTATTVSFRGMDITAVAPNTFDVFKQLESINLQRNRLEEIPEDLFSANTQLKSLSLSGNQIRVFHKGTLKGLSQLNHLTLSSNQLTDLHPSTFIDNPLLDYLYLYNNQFTSFDYNIFQNLTKLRRLELNNNRLRSFDFDSISHLRAMQYLYFEDNAITFFPISQFSAWFPNLVDLGISLNDIRCPDMHTMIDELESANIPIRHFDGDAGISTKRIYNITCLDELTYQLGLINDLRADLSQVQMQCEVLDRNNAELTIDLESTRSELSGVVAELQAVKSSFDEVTNELGEIRGQQDILRDEMQTVGFNVSALAEKSETLQEQFFELYSKMTELRVGSMDLEARIGQVEGCCSVRELFSIESAKDTN